MTDTDVGDLLDVLERCEPAAADDIFYADVLAGLRELIPCDDITFQLMDVAEQRVNLLCVTDDGVQREECHGAEDEFLQLFWREFWEEDGCAGPLSTGDYATVLHQAETWSTRAYANTPLGSQFAAMGVKDEVLVPMTPLGGIDRRLLLFRNAGSPEFSEREKAMLALARPHIAELHTRRDRELRGEPHLTPRQWEVLRRVATGAGNTQIARALGLSEATVRKHLENVFVRLGVQSRTEAVARVLAFMDVA
ncbi:MAG TPA: LuxR C-terminal-related transcriptional regulator [Nocardioides sp.]|jgi:DNA-binding CsgD family transcriptional regulator|nr:LuxR C-terminal-related transcriptional regulator [Nocardioides sp.]HET9842562.1 LuxR C-terminal-related transcriptional regulator [Nocardioides sp.]